MQIPALVFPDGGWCEALGTSYRPGPYQPRTADEYKALAPFAIDAPELEEDGVSIPSSALRDKASLCAWAKETHGLDISPDAGTKDELKAQILAAIEAR